MSTLTNHTLELAEPFERIRKKRSRNRPSRSSSGGQSKKAIRAERKKYEKGFGNEDRFWQVMHKYRERWSGDNISDFRASTQVEDEKDKIDVWCCLVDGRDIPVQIKSSFENMRQFNATWGRTHLCIVVRESMRDLEIYTEFCRIMKSFTRR